MFPFYQPMLPSTFQLNLNIIGYKDNHTLKKDAYFALILKTKRTGLKKVIQGTWPYSYETFLLLFHFFLFAFFM